MKTDPDLTPVVQDATLRAHRMKPFKVSLDPISQCLIDYKTATGEISSMADLLRYIPIAKQNGGHVWQNLLAYRLKARSLNGDESGLDIIISDFKIGMELKSAFNTLNSGGKNDLLNKLARFGKADPKNKPVWAILKGQGGKSGSKVIEHDGIKIEKLTGDALTQRLLNCSVNDIGKMFRTQFLRFHGMEGYKNPYLRTLEIGITDCAVKMDRV